MRSKSRSYINLGGSSNNEESTAWYWRLIALAASWMILGSYLILPGLYDKNADLKFSQAVLSVFVVALMTAGYSFTALLCFACRNPSFRADGIFLPALTSSAIGLLTIAYNFLASKRYNWNTAAITGTVLSTASTLIYGMLLLWTHRRMVKEHDKDIAASPKRSSASLWSEPTYYSNYVDNMYPSARNNPSPTPHQFEIPQSEEDRINQQMALLLRTRNDATPSRDTASATFRIDMPEDRELRERVENSQELVGTPPSAHSDWDNRSRSVSAASRPIPAITTSGSRPGSFRTSQNSLTEDQAWEQWHRGRTEARPSSTDARGTSHSRAVSREERRREIESGFR